MASAVPYDPDDFDNNPFAENTIATPDSYQQEEPNGNDNTLDNNDGNDNDNDNDNRPLLNSSSSKNTKTSDSITSTTTTTATDSEFTEFPTELDLKKYLPERLHKDKFQLIIKIQEIEGNGPNTSKNPIFKFNAKVTKTSAFRKEIYKNVRRTYKEIESLYKYLIYNNIEVFIPALPTVSSLYTPMSPEFITSVTNSFQNWFNRICCNPLLIKNKEFALFFEQNDFGYVPSKTKPSNNSVIATGLKRKTLKQFHPPYDSCEYLAQYRPMIKEVHLSCQKLLEKLDKCLKYQRQSAYYNNEFIILLGNLTNLESSPEMSKLWKKFNKFSSMLNETDLIKNVSLISELISFFRQIGDDTYNIKESLTNRHLLMRELINAEEATKKKHSIISKLKTKSTIDPLKVDEAIRSLELYNNLEKELRYQVKRTTYEMLIESKEYISYMVLSSKKLFKILAKHQIIQERKKLNLLINNRLINQHDSLSRLGRENLPEHIPINKSNSNARDSWNSRPKKSYADPMSRNSSQIKNNDISEEISNVDAKSAASLLAGINF
jgi:hypothetical protein